MIDFIRPTLSDLPAHPVEIAPPLPHGTINQYHAHMNRRHRATLEAIFARPVPSTIRWSDIESLFVALGAEVRERASSRVAVVLFGQVQVFHRPHPRPETDKGAVVAIRRWLDSNGVKP
ncbi:type II toxin-antitoxin system HicA family toxin [Geminicoccus harenae]|uniref:type II toxin-antitoxin system HicA family toxin n=1 Tax=Geminicoccus harenae TaxID=2498453 RepID=UPI001CC2DE82|nr:type II toxin-antitoxin system HicA family toxin [Geminicoccus harenae]